MRFLFVSDRVPRAPSTCANCSTPIGTSYLRDLSSRRLYCDRRCYLGAAVPFTGAGELGLQWADDFQRALFGGSDN
jgi:hypothetical protein